MSIQIHIKVVQMLRDLQTIGKRDFSQTLDGAASKLPCNIDLIKVF